MRRRKTLLQKVVVLDGDLVEGCNEFMSSKLREGFFSVKFCESFR